MRYTVILLLFFSRVNASLSSSIGISGNLFAKDRTTGITGFGARKNTIFPRKSANNTLVDGQSRKDFSLSKGKNQTIFTDHPKLWVQKSNDALWIQIRGENPKTFCITISKEAGDWTVREGKETEEMQTEWIPIEGLYGIHVVPSGIIWVLVSKTEPAYSAPPIAGKNSWWEIRRVSSLELVHLSYPDMLLSPSHLKEEVRQLRLLRKSLKEHEFYFVPSEENGVIKDMTKNIQTSIERTIASNERARWWESTDERPDPRFFWNQAAVEPILNRYENRIGDKKQQSLTAALLHHVVPLTSAFLGVQSNLTVGEETPITYQQVLISRRSRFRAGTRFTRRGADASGAVANYAETEQICLILDDERNTQQVTSHLQIRGSIPLRWSSPADVKTYRPRVRIGMDPLSQARALRLHLLEQHAYYGPLDGTMETSNSAEIIFVNLIDKKNDQGRLGQAFDAVLNAVMDVHATDVSGPSSVEHVWFDFHAEVKDGKWNRLGVLLKKLQPALNNHGYFLAEAPSKEGEWNIKSRQNAIVRTNCMDCLDRTNVVQSIFGRFMLFQQLSKAANRIIEDNDKSKKTWVRHALAFRKKQLSLPWGAGEVAHRLLWADNADAISRLYAGTPALKGDFTRTGKRTKKGALDDGMNSLQRYYLNNFLDADRQEGMDLMVGYANFSNVAFLESENGYSNDDEESSSTQEDDEKTLSLIQEAARKALFGDVMDGLSSQHRKDLKERLGDIGVQDRTKRKSLDLRWLPGDLQVHMISQADEVESTGKVFEFDSAKALESIDRRAASDLPWWAVMEEDTESTDDESHERSTEKNSDDEGDHSLEVGSYLAPHQRHPSTRPIQFLFALVFGVKAPLSLAAAVVTLVGFVYLPAVIEHDISSQ